MSFPTFVHIAWIMVMLVTVVWGAICKDEVCQWSAIVFLCIMASSLVLFYCVCLCVECEVKAEKRAAKRAAKRTAKWMAKWAARDVECALPMEAERVAVVIEALDPPIHISRVSIQGGSNIVGARIDVLQM